MNRNDVLIVCALKQETQGQLTEGSINDWNILYTGVGKVNATLKLTQKFGKFGSHIPYDLVINYGTAGSRDLPIGELVDCTKFIQRDMDVTGLGFMKHQTPYESPNGMVIRCTSKFNPIGKHYTCGTGDSFVENTEDGDGNINVFDMEAYALSKVCHHYDINFISFKYITDNANEHSANDWTENCSAGIHLFKSQILSKIT